MNTNQNVHLYPGRMVECQQGFSQKCIHGRKELAPVTICTSRYFLYNYYTQYIYCVFTLYLAYFWELLPKCSEYIAEILEKWEDFEKYRNYLKKVFFHVFFKSFVFLHYIRCISATYTINIKYILSITIQRASGRRRSP